MQPWTTPYPTLRQPAMARNVVSTSQPLAAQAEAVLRRETQRHAESVAVLNNPARTLSDQGRNEAALAAMELAAALEGPFANAVHETRSLILQRMRMKNQ